MKLSFLPLLQVQRDLYAMPRGMERFREYIKTMTDAETGDLALPLVAMNPMGKDHIPALIDEYIALGAEGSRSKRSGRRRRTGGRAMSSGVGLVVSDDLKAAGRIGGPANSPSHRERRASPNGGSSPAFCGPASRPPPLTCATRC